MGRILELDHSSKSRTLARQKGCPSCTFPIACAMDLCGFLNPCEEGLQCIQCPCGCDYTCGEYPGS
ncbi:hypothetical protein P5673_027857 [Acropora cervicornis]|uniref:Uncharacterized protein n=1 Tax=Acropora cervicornis TaxID=6130 RepID=A0AAD9UVA8_ACRCE|nr:hypothetical protein P5673_027857 [Acropora cervicornis]